MQEEGKGELGPLSEGNHSEHQSKITGNDSDLYINHHGGQFSQEKMPELLTLSRVTKEKHE